MYIAPRQVQTAHRGQNFDVNRNVLSLYSFVASFKKISMKSDFIHFFFMILYMCIVPRQGLTTPWGQNFYVNRNILSLWSFVASFKKSLWSLILYSFFFFHDFIHVYSPRAGADSPQGTKFWCQQKGLISLLICCKFQTNLIEVWFYSIFFHDLIPVYILGAGGIQPPWGQSFYVNRNFLSLWSSVASFKS